MIVDVRISRVPFAEKALHGFGLRFPEFNRRDFSDRQLLRKNLNKFQRFLMKKSEGGWLWRMRRMENVRVA